MESFFIFAFMLSVANIHNLFCLAETNDTPNVIRISKIEYATFTRKGKHQESYSFFEFDNNEEYKTSTAIIQYEKSYCLLNYSRCIEWCLH